MKIKTVPAILTAAVLSFLLSFGGIGCLVTAFRLDASLTVLALFCGVCAVGGCVIFSFSKGGPLMLCGLALLGGYLWQKGEIVDQILRLCYDISRIYNLAYGCGCLGNPLAADTVALPLYFWGGLTALIAGWFISRRRFAAIAVFFSLLPLALCLVVTNTIPAVGYLFLLLLGLILLLLTQSVRRRDANQAAALTWMLAIPTVLALTLLFLANPQAKYDKQPQAEDIQDTVLQWVDKLPYVDVTVDGTLKVDFARDVPDSVSLQSVGPNTQFGVRVMEVTAETSGPLYLRGRDYDQYTGTDWNASPDRSEAFTKLSPDTYFYGGQDIRDNGNLTIHTFGIRSVRYLPYYPASSCAVQSGARGNPSNETTYSYQWCTLPEDFWVAIDDSVVYASRGSTAALPDLISSTYFVYSYTAPAFYLQLPDSTREWAEDYLAAHLTVAPEEGIHATANAIAALVRDSAAYNLNTARMPDGQTDFAKWFLEESDTGYCVHYATATTVLLRAAGISARYVEGYMTEAVAGKTVTVTEKDAHAWAEYYISGIGWIPLESTAAVLNEEEGIPVFAPEGQTQATDETTTVPSATATESTAPSTADREPTDGGEATGTSAATQPQPAEKQPTKITLSPSVVFLLLLLAGLAGQYPIRLRLRQKYLQTGSINARVLKKWRYVCRLAWLLHQTPPEELEELALRAKFSQHILTGEDLASLDTFCSEAADRLRRSPWWLRLYHRLFWAAY